MNKKIPSHLSSIAGCILLCVGILTSCASKKLATDSLTTQNDKHEAEVPRSRFVAVVIQLVADTMQRPRVLEKKSIVFDDATWTYWAVASVPDSLHASQPRLAIWRWARGSEFTDSPWEACFVDYDTEAFGWAFRNSEGKLYASDQDAIHLSPEEIQRYTLYFMSEYRKAVKTLIEQFAR